MEVFIILLIGFLVFFGIYAFQVYAKSKKGEDKTERQYENDNNTARRVSEFRLNGASGANQVKNAKVAPKKKAEPAKKPVPGIGLSKNIAARTGAHTHPVEPGAKYRVERVDMGGSLGGISTEGCADQYFQRLVKLNDADASNGEPNYDLIKTIVYGEMLNNPKYKKRK